MPISPIVLQRRQAELGRIRLGQKNPGKGFPMKLDRFRFTSVSEQYVKDLAELYGGTAQPWDNNGIPSWEVITDATSIPVIVVKNGLSQWMETWSGGGCIHRCDGEVNVLTNEPCDPNDKAHLAAKPTTRLSVMLPELEAIGTFRMESHGWNAAAEIPAVAELAQFVGDLVPAVLHLVERRTVKDGQTSRFVVPVLDLQIGAAKLREVVAAKSGIGELDAPASAGAPAIEAAPAKVESFTVEEIDAVDDIDTLRNMWKAADDESKAMIQARVKALQDQEPVEGETVGPTREQVWQECMTLGGQLDMSMWDLETRLQSDHDVSIADADAETLSVFLETLRDEVAA